MDPRIKAYVDRLVNEKLQAVEAERKQKAEGDLKDGVVVGSKTSGGTATWRNGFWIESPNKDFTFHVGGCIQYDLALYTADNNIQFGPRGVGPFQDGVNFRRGRLRAEGTMWEVIDYRFELEFFNGVEPPGAPAGTGRPAQGQVFMTPGPTDAWITLTHLPVVGNIRVGNQKEPIGLDHLESFRFLPFLERSPLFDFLTATAYNNGFTPGVSVFNNYFEERVTTALGVFKNSYDVYGFGYGDGQYAATGRLTYLPYYADNGLYLVHLGLAGSYRDPVSQENRFRVRPSVRNGPAPNAPYVPVLIDTGFFGTGSEQLGGLEFFANFKHLTIQAEWQMALNQDTTVAGNNLGTTYFYGAYVQALYWLTGEYTRWDKKAAAPDRYVVNRPFYLVEGPSGWLHGLGAWQVGLRYSWVDLNDKSINGGQLDDLTLGLNWILNPNTKFQWNYEWGHRHGIQAASNGTFQAFGVRMQVDF